MKYICNDAYKSFNKELKRFIDAFETSGKPFIVGTRNTIKLFELHDEIVNIKAFKIPNVFNQIAYNFFRKSKAQRSFEYANRLLDLGIGTPKPIAYFEFSTLLFFKKSYYVSEHLECDLTYRELIHNPNYPDHEGVLRAFTRFTYELHEKGVWFLDHSPGNTLIKLNGSDEYKFYLVDLNRMKFGSLSFEERIKNFSRLTPLKDMVKVMSDEYAKCNGENYEKTFDLMWRETKAFQEKFNRKKRLKKKFLFWRKPR